MYGTVYDIVQLIFHGCGRDAENVQRVYVHCDEDSTYDEEEKPRYLPHFNFSVFDIVILGILETIAYFGVMIRVRPYRQS